MLHKLKTGIMGQGLVEYGLILALVSVVAVGSLGGMGGKVEESFDKVVNVDGSIEYSPVEWFSFNRVDGGYEITGFDFEYINDELGGVQPKEISIPAYYQGSRVVQIADGVSDGSLAVYEPIFDNVVSVSFPHTIKRIGTAAFAISKVDRGPDIGLTGEVIIPDSVQSIGGHAFIGNNITKLQLSNRLSHIRLGSFQFNSLAEVVIPESVVSIETRAFTGNRLESVYIPESTKSLAGDVFTLNGENGNSKSISSPGDWVLKGIKWVSK